MELKFDLIKLSSQGADFKGAWMDICFIASLNDEETSQEIYVDSGDVEVDTLQSIHVNQFSYAFATWHNALKIYFSDFFGQYNIAANMDGDVPQLTISFDFADAFAGQKATVSWWQNSEFPAVTSDIGADGSATFAFNLTDFVTDKLAYAHLTINDADGGTIVGGTDTNLPFETCLTDLETVTGVGAMREACKVIDSATGIAYYAGLGDNGGLCLYARNESFVLPDTYLANIKDKPALILTADTTWTTEELTAGPGAAIGVDFEDSEYNTDTNPIQQYYIPERITAAVEDGVATIALDLSSMTKPGLYYCHYRMDVSNNGTDLAIGATSDVETDTLKYHTEVRDPANWGYVILTLTIEKK